MVFGCVPRYSATCPILGRGGRPAPVCSCMYKFWHRMVGISPACQQMCLRPRGRTPRSEYENWRVGGYWPTSPNRSMSEVAHCARVLAVGIGVPGVLLRSVATPPSKERVRGLKHPLACGVSDGTRTRDIQDHNLTLYQLNYTHHCRQTRAATSILAARVLGGRIDIPRRGRRAANLFDYRLNVAGRRSRWRDESGAPVVTQFTN